MKTNKQIAKYQVTVWIGSNYARPIQRIVTAWSRYHAVRVAQTQLVAEGVQTKRARRVSVGYLDKVA